MVSGDHPEARWLPSRSHFAIFRLGSYIRLRVGSAPPNQLLTTFAVDRDQNAFENYAVATGVLIAAVSYIAALLANWIPNAAAVMIAIVITPAVTHIPFFISGLLVMPAWRRISGRPGANNLAANSFASAAVILACSLYFAWKGGPAGVVADAVLAFAALNVFAAIVMWMIRNHVRELETRCGA